MSQQDLLVGKDGMELELELLSHRHEQSDKTQRSDSMEEESPLLLDEAAWSLTMSTTTVGKFVCQKCCSAVIL